MGRVSRGFFFFKKANKSINRNTYIYIYMVFGVSFFGWLRRLGALIRPPVSFRSAGGTTAAGRPSPGRPPLSTASCTAWTGRVDSMHVGGGGGGGLTGSRKEAPPPPPPPRFFFGVVAPYQKGASTGMPYFALENRPVHLLIVLFLFFLVGFRQKGEPPTWCCARQRDTKACRASPPEDLETSGPLLCATSYGGYIAAWASSPWEASKARWVNGSKGP